MNAILATTTNSTVFRIAYREVVCRRFGLCSRCPWHDAENYGRRASRSWKAYRRNQYRMV